MANDFTSPNHDGPRQQTKGIVIHATLGGFNHTLPQEFDSVVAWFNNPASQVSAHAVIGAGPHNIWYPIQSNLIGWHCDESNQEWLGVEACKCFVTDKLDPSIEETLAWQCAYWCVQYDIPPQWSTVNGIEEHRNMPSNHQGHRDIGGPFVLERDSFMMAVKGYVAILGGNGVILTDAQKIKLLDHLNVLWGYTTADTIVKDPHESEKACHERIVAIKVLLGLNN